MPLVRSCDSAPFQGRGPLSHLASTEFRGITTLEYADLALSFMLGVPSPHGAAGFCMLSPSDLKKERVTVVKYWVKRLNMLRQTVAKASKR